MPETLAGERDINALVTPLVAQNFFHQQQKRANIINAAFQTALFFLLLYSLIYLLNTKAKFAQYIIVYCLLQSIYFLNQHSYLYAIDWVAERPLLPNYIHLLFLNLLTYADLQLIRHYLNLKEHLPIWNRLFKGLMIMSIVATILSVTLYWITDNFNWSYMWINSGFSFIYLCFRLVFVFRIYRLKATHRFRIMAIALGVSMLFLLTAIAGFFIQPLDGSFFLQMGNITYIIILVLSLGHDAAITQKEKIRAVQKQMAQQKSLELKEQELRLSQQKEKITRLQHKELERVDKMKSRFFANVSHELRTPLTLMLGPLQTALADQTLNNRSFTLLKLAKNNGERLLKLVNQILDLTKLEATGLELNLSEVHFYSFLKRLIASFESHAAQEQLHFLFDYQLDKDLILQMDAAKVEIIMTNLLSNAFKFTPAHQHITLRASAINGGIQIEVADTGRGIHLNDLPYIFDRFYQTSRQNAQSEGGTGIGLALSKEFAHLMRGTLRVESEWQKGSSFFFEWPAMEVVRAETTAEYQESLTTNPVHRPPVAFSEKKSTEKQEADRPTLLIVEDNIDLSNYLKVILAPTYQLLSAKNGQVALDLLSEIIRKTEETVATEAPNLPDLIVSDIMMPVMDGFGFLKILKSKDYFRAIPVIMLTARAGISDKLEALRIGVDDYLLKPFVEEELLTRIHNLLENYKNRVHNSTYLGSEDTLNSQKNRTTASTTQVKKPVISTEDYHWLQQVETVVIENLEHVYYNLDDLANDLGVSKRQLDRRVKKLIALNIGQYVKEIRYAQAKKLLENRQYTSIKMVAYKVGIKDKANFSRQFKKRYGKLPSAYL
ncbi:MAG: ATP-binding protein [Bacteroidota bacterium]